jgi:hypothetical protein
MPSIQNESELSRKKDPADSAALHHPCRSPAIVLSEMITGPLPAFMGDQPIGKMAR